MVTLEMVHGQLQIVDRAREYIDRGDLLEDWSFLSFFLDSYDGFPVKQSDNLRGRRPNTRIAYREGTGRDGHCRVIRSPGHETMPYFPGQWFPKKNPDDCNGIFEASMLALLKPWRSLTDLKRPNQTFREAYDDFLCEASSETCRIIKNIQYFHECGEHARQRTDTIIDTEETCRTTVWTEIEDPAEGPLGGEEVNDEHFEDLITEEDISRVIDQPFSSREYLFAEKAIDIGLKSGALQIRKDNATYADPAPLATENDLRNFQNWHALLDASESRDEEQISIPMASEILPLRDINLDMVYECEPTASTITRESHSSIGSSECILNERQTMVHRIVTNHLQDHLLGKNPPQRLLIVHGQGGTGKSALLNAISSTFEELGASHLLANTATSGVAASIIKGQTLHSWAALPIFTPRSDRWITHPTKEVLARRKKNMGNVLWLTIDEMSMLTTPLLLYLSRAAGVVRTGLNTIAPSVLFGGLSVILFGDLHQFPPVAKPTKELYYPFPEDDDCRLGRSYYEQFNIVIKLEEQIRIQDAEWNDILQRTRTGECTMKDIEVIKKLVLTHPDCDIPDFSRPPWSETILVTSRNGVRSAWNELMLRQHACKSGQIRYVVYANDQTNGQPLTKRQRLATAHLTLDETQKLPHKIEIVKGMKAMILMNISTDSDLANGSRGIIEDIILDPREGEPTRSSSICLRYPPAVILFRPLFGRNQKFPGLPVGVVPIFPTCRRFKIGGRSGVFIDREQYALTPAYAFTDFKSQGQTIESVIVDLARPPSGKLTGFNSYVALSRSRGKSTIRLLRDFDEKLFTVHPNEHLRREDVRLDNLEKETMDRYEAGEFGCVCVDK